MATAMGSGHGQWASEGIEMPKTLKIMFATLLVWAWPAIGWSDGLSQQEMRSLDEQVQEIKTDVLSIAAELSMLEERLLYPSSTQLAVFVSLAEEDSFRLDAVQIHIDGELATHHIYSFKELDALQSGGVQRIFTGNVGTGEHELEVSVIGKLESGKEYQQSERFTFTKGVDPRLLGVALAGPSAGQAPIQLHDW
jgi:hypothetical protein